MEVNIGEIIKAKVKENGMTYTEFTDRLEMKRSGVYSMFERSNIDTNLLNRVCQILKYDFYQHFLEKETVDKLIKERRVVKAKVMVEIDLTDEDIEAIQLQKRAMKQIYQMDNIQSVAEEGEEYNTSSDLE